MIDPRTGQSRVEGDLEAAFAPDGIFDELAGIARETGADCASQPDTADEFQKCLDDIAIAEAGRFRPSIVRIILLHGAAALLAAIVTFQLAKGSAWEEWKWVLTATELLLVSYALWLGVHLHRRHTQSRWIRCRFACELVRGLRASVPLIDPLAPSVGVHDPRWRRFALSVGLLVNQQQVGLDPTALRDRYLATRLSETHPEGQIRHYLTKKPKALWWWKTTEQVSQWSALLAPAFVLASLANKTLHWGHQEHFAGWVVVSLMPIALPLLAGVANGIRQALDAGRRKERYPEMAERLIAIREHLGGLETRSSISRAVSQSEEILLDELREWQLTATTTGH
ncbi:MAG TPA: hypothetical protein PLA50_07925 [Bacteroidia bacterium]|nr:hypothetical protein [Bacteroidia bacterium]